MITIAKPQIVVEKAVKDLVENENEKCTIVHCKLYSTDDSLLRIWPSTYLVEDNGTRRKLIKEFNISLAPNWTLYPNGQPHASFTLVFEGLSRPCKSFHLFEDIKEPGGFYTDIILRNKSDVYTAVLALRN